MGRKGSTLNIRCVGWASFPAWGMSYPILYPPFSPRLMKKNALYNNVSCFFTEKRKSRHPPPVPLMPCAGRDITGWKSQWRHFPLFALPLPNCQDWQHVSLADLFQMYYTPFSSVNREMLNFGLPLGSLSSMFKHGNGEKNNTGSRWHDVPAR